MLDIKFIRNNIELVRQAISNKNEKADLDKLLEIDEQRRQLQFAFDNLKAHQNSVSALIAQKKKTGENIENELKAMTKTAEEIKALSAQLSIVNGELEKLLLTIPNIPKRMFPLEKMNQPIKS